MRNLVCHFSDVERHDMQEILVRVIFHKLKHFSFNERTKERFIDPGRLPMSNREVGDGGWGSGAVGGGILCA